MVSLCFRFCRPRQHVFSSERDRRDVNGRRSAPIPSLAMESSALIRQWKVSLFWSSVVSTPWMHGTVRDFYSTEYMSWPRLEEYSVLKLDMYIVKICVQQSSHCASGLWLMWTLCWIVSPSPTVSFFLPIFSPFFCGWDTRSFLLLFLHLTLLLLPPLLQSLSANIGSSIACTASSYSSSYSSSGMGVLWVFEVYNDCADYWNGIKVVCTKLQSVSFTKQCWVQHCIISNPANVVQSRKHCINRRTLYKSAKLYDEHKGTQ